MGMVLAVVTLLVLLIIVLALVIYLLRIIAALHRSTRHLQHLADGLDAVAQDTQPLREKLSTIQQALGEILAGLQAVEAHLARVVRLLMS